MINLFKASNPDPEHPADTENEGTNSPPSKDSASPESQTVPENASKESLMDLLTQDVSWDVIKRVLHYEIPVPFSLRHVEPVDFEAGNTWHSSKELEELGKSKNLVQERMGEILVERGYLTAEQFDQARQHMKRTSQPLWRALLQLKFVTFQQMLRLYRLELPSGSLPDNKYIHWLQKKRRLPRSTLARAWEEAKKRKVQFADYLVGEKLATEEDVAQALAHQMEVPYASLKGIHRVPRAVTHRLPLNLPIRFNAIPFKFREGTLYVAFSSYEDIISFERLGLLLDYKVQPVLAPRHRLTHLIQQFIRDHREELQEATPAGRNPLESEIEISTQEDLTLSILRGLIERQGTDIHIEPQTGFYRVRFRVDGLLHDLLTLDVHSARRVLNQLKAQSNLDLSDPFHPQDGHVRIRVLNEDKNFRISTLPTPAGEKMVLRLVKPDYAFSRFEQLGMTVEQRQLMHTILNVPAGLILASGPVGSGKTTTLYSCLNCMNLFTQNVTTIEDPIEFELPGATQAQVNLKVDLTFAAGLRSILRQDPDVIMVGEIRDEETAAIAVRAAMTGQKVLSTIHANSATNAISSLILVNVRPPLISNALAGIIFQRLVRKVCPHCAQSRTADASVRRQLGLPSKQRLTYRHGDGCASCLYTGYQGQTCVFEILRNSTELSETLVSDPSQSNLDRVAMNAGFMPLRLHVLELVRAGTLSPVEAARIL